MLKQGLVLGMLCLTGQAYANITVNTTDDVVKDDKVCSLREAITYVNEYLSDSTKKDAGYFGCGGKDASSTIILEQNKTYLLNSEIAIKKPLVIQTQSNDLDNNSKSYGIKNATIKASGTHRLFTIDDGQNNSSAFNVGFNQVNLQGCGLTNVCADQGGLILNREALILQYTQLSQGYAKQGGAIYNENVVTSSNIGSSATVAISDSILAQNKADQGAVIYSTQPQFRVTNSVIRFNQTLSDMGTVFYSANPIASTGTVSYGNSLINSSIFKNTGYLLNLRDGSYVNNVTAVDNQRGFYFDTSNRQAFISNSILVNNAQNCAYANQNKVFAYNNVVGDSSCGTGEQNNPNTDLSTRPHNKIFASTDNISIAADGKELSCDRPPADGLLCPYKTPKDSFLGFFKPRLLSAYKTLADSPIINAGRIYSDGSNLGLNGCQSNDQRGYSRGTALTCDVGAIELIISSDTVSRVGQDLLYGETAKIDVTNSLGDGELLPQEECQAILGKPEQYGLSAWQNGCLRVEQISNVTPESKGTLTLSEDGQLTYQPKSNWHGTDEFNLRVITTASRFSESAENRNIMIPVRIVQAPPKGISNDKLSVAGGGSMGALSLLGLMTLAFYRRFKA